MLRHQIKFLFSFSIYIFTKWLTQFWRISIYFCWYFFLIIISIALLLHVHHLFTFVGNVSVLKDKSSYALAIEDAQQLYTSTRIMTHLIFFSHNFSFGTQLSDIGFERWFLIFVTTFCIFFVFLLRTFELLKRRGPTKSFFALSFPRLWNYIKCRSPQKKTI